jgi:hypothetical protein
MSTVLDPRISEFETAEQAARYERWFRAQIAASLADGQPTVAHDQVMAEMDAIIDEIGRGKASQAKS